MFFPMNFQYLYPPVIKRGLLENTPFTDDILIIQFIDSKLPAPAVLHPEAFHDHSCQNCLESLAAPARMQNA